MPQVVNTTDSEPFAAGGATVTEAELQALLEGATAERGTKEQLAISALFRAALAQVSQREGIPEHQIVGLSFPERAVSAPVASVGAVAAARTDGAVAAFGVIGLLLVGATAAAALWRGDVTAALWTVILGQTVGGALLLLMRRR